MVSVATSVCSVRKVENRKQIPVHNIVCTVPWRAFFNYTADHINRDHTDNRACNLLGNEVGAAAQPLHTTGLTENAID